MPEQALTALLGSMGTALVGAVGGLVYVVRRGSYGKNHNGGSALRTLELTLQQLNTTLSKQTDTLQKLSDATTIHNIESAGRHAILTTILAQLQERGR